MFGNLKNLNNMACRQKNSMEVVGWHNSIVRIVTQTNLNALIGNKAFKRAQFELWRLEL